jgi:hypothetical protein
MDAIDQTQPSPPRLSDRWRDLVLELGKIARSEKLGEILLGVFYALRDRDNPEAIQQAAHSLRELMGRMEEIYSELQFKKPKKGGDGTLKAQVIELRAHWDHAQTSPCLKAGKWSGELDAKVAKLLNAFGKLFRWQDENERLRKNREIATIKGMDPLSDRLSQEVQEARTKEWRRLKEYFTAVSHHGKLSNFTEMETALNSFEEFLYAALAPDSAKNQTAIQDLIAEVESNGN